MDWHEHEKTLPRRLIDVIRAQATMRPDAPAVSDANGVRSYRELSRAIDALAARLELLGVRPGDRVVLVAENCFQSVCAFYAITALDAWAVLVNSRLAPPEIDRIVAAAGSRLTLYGSASAPDTHPHAKLSPTQKVEGPDFGVVAASEIDETVEPEPVHHDGRAQVAAMIYTSGSTGVPKGVMLTHHALAHQCALTTIEREFRPQEKFYVVAPITHIFGFSTMLLAPMFIGAQIKLVPRFDVEATVSALRDGVTRLYGAPPMFTALVEHAKKTGTDYRSFNLRDLVAGGATADQTLRAAVEQAFGLPLGLGYAATEFTPLAGCSSMRPVKPGSSGRPWSANEVRIVGAGGEIMPTGAVGEIQCRGTCVMLGYYRNEAATAAALKPGGWFATGDLGYLDADGELFVVSRLKDVINRSGFKVYPAEVESVLDRYPAVALSAVVGRKVEGNEEVIAFVQPRQGVALDRDDMDRHLRSQLAPYKLPTHIELMPALPVGPTGKILRLDLAEAAKSVVVAPTRSRSEPV